MKKIAYLGEYMAVNVTVDGNTLTTSALHGEVRHTFSLPELYYWQAHDELGIGIAYMMPQDTPAIISLDFAAAIEAMLAMMRQEVTL